MIMMISHGTGTLSIKIQASISIVVRSGLVAIATGTLQWRPMILRRRRQPHRAPPTLPPTPTMAVRRHVPGARPVTRARLHRPRRRCVAVQSAERRSRYALCVLTGGTRREPVVVDSPEQHAQHAFFFGPREVREVHAATARARGPAQLQGGPDGVGASVRGARGGVAMAVDGVLAGERAADVRTFELDLLADLRGVCIEVVIEVCCWFTYSRISCEDGSSGLFFYVYREKQELRAQRTQEHRYDWVFTRAPNRVET